MSNSSPLRVAIVGCGNIAGAYGSAITSHADSLQLLGACDMDRQRAEQLTQQHGGQVYDSLEAVLSDPQVEVVVNLTTHHAHVGVITRTLEAGKHVYTEKPLALDANDAQQLVQLAQQRGLRLASAPITFLGEAAQTALKLIHDDLIGPVRIVYAEMNWNRIEVWHPAPGPFYQVGSMFDVGVYPLTIMTAILGPVTQVQAFGGVLQPQRQTRDGQAFTVETPDWMCALLQFESGPRCRLTTSFYVGESKQNGIEFHGDKGTLHLADAAAFNAALQLKEFGGGEWQDQLLPEGAFEGVDWARGLVDLEAAIRDNRPHRATGSQAAHVVEIAAAVHGAIASGETITINSRFSLPEPWL
jgi:predicted dehydrogenase